MKKFLLINTIILSLGASLSFASGGSHSAPQVSDLLFPFINFVILLMLLYFFLRSKAVDFFRSRSTNIKVDIEKSKEMYADAYRKYEEIEGKLKNADIEGKELLKSLKDEAELEKKHMVKAASEFSEKLKSDSERIINNELKKATRRLKKETVNLATMLAKQELQKEMSAEQQKQLGAEFVDQLKEV